MAFGYKGDPVWRVSAEDLGMIPTTDGNPITMGTRTMGAARIPRKGGGPGYIQVIFSDGMGWEHVSGTVRLSPNLFITPSWNEMCILKDMFWDPEDCVVQFHPSRSQYVNVHPNVLHLWRPVGRNFDTPPTSLIG